MTDEKEPLQPESPVNIEDLVVADPNFPHVNPFITLMIEATRWMAEGRKPEPRSKADEKLARVKRDIANPQRYAQLGQQERFIEKTWKDIEADELFQPVKYKESSRLGLATQPIKDHVEKKYPKMMPANTVECVARGEFVQKINHAIEQGLLKNIILYAEVLGILENPNPVHLHDICCQDGMSSAIMAFLRKQMPGKPATSCLCCDIDNMEVPNFAFVHQLFETEDPRFVLADAPHATFKNHPERDTYWIIKEPGAGINLLMQRIIEASQTPDFPKGVALGTCYCHCFSEEAYPLGDMEEPILSEDNWRELTDIIVAANFDPNRESRKIAKRAMQLIDCARAKFLIQKGQGLSARVLETPGEWTSGIVIQKKAG